MMEAALRRSRSQTGSYDSHRSPYDGGADDYAALMLVSPLLRRLNRLRIRAIHDGKAS
jgi:hypothetical protein